MKSNQPQGLILGVAPGFGACLKPLMQLALRETTSATLTSSCFTQSYIFFYINQNQIQQLLLTLCVWLLTCSRLKNGQTTYYCSIYCYGDKTCKINCLCTTGWDMFWKVICVSSHVLLSSCP